MSGAGTDGTCTGGTRPARNRRTWRGGAQGRQQVVPVPGQVSERRPDPGHDQRGLPGGR